VAGQTELKRALALLAAGDWDGAHQIAQRDETHTLYCWLHAILHKIEGDSGNARYWYARAGRRYEDFPHPTAEIAAFEAALG